MKRITVLMPVCNAAPYIKEAVQSILSQSYTAFELLIIDDGSTDGTLDKIKRFTDPRIRLIAHPANFGLVSSLNEGIELSASEYIARMDGDDIALPNRLERQIAYMDANPDVGVCGSQAHYLGTDSVTTKPLEHEQIRCWQLFHCTFIHPSVMIRRSVLDACGIRYLPYPHAEDYEIWNRLGDVTRLVNLPDVLMRYRLHPNQVSNKYNVLQEATAEQIRRQQLGRLGLVPTPEEYALHLDFVHYRIRVHEPSHYNRALAWANKILEANRVTPRYDQGTLNTVLSQCFYYSEMLS